VVDPVGAGLDGGVLVLGVVEAAPAGAGEFLVGDVGADLVVAGDGEVQVAAHMGAEELVGAEAGLVLQVPHGHGQAGIDTSVDVLGG
jgi:hypothetical protein